MLDYLLPFNSIIRLALNHGILIDNVDINPTYSVIFHMIALGRLDSKVFHGR